MRHAELNEAWRRAMAATITEVREEHGLSKRALARQLDCEPSYVVQWEQAQGISPGWVLEIEISLGLETGELMGRAAGKVAHGEHANSGDIVSEDIPGCLSPRIEGLLAAA